MDISHKTDTTQTKESSGSDHYHSLLIVVDFGKNKLEIPSKINEHLLLYKSDIERLTKGDKEIFRLLCSGFLSKKMLDNYVKNKIFPIYHLLEDEKFVISKILEIRKYKSIESISPDQLENDYRQYTLEISEVFDKHIKRGYLKELRELFSVAAENAGEKELFKLTDFLIHFINWGNSFYNYYDTCFDIIPGHLRKVENNLSISLRTKIKAYLAFHTHINTLKRLLEKREQGRISTLSVLDWKTDIKLILLKQFNEFFGRRKAEEYIKSLEEIIDLAVE